MRNLTHETSIFTLLLFELRKAFAGQLSCIHDLYHKLNVPQPIETIFWIVHWTYIYRQENAARSKTIYAILVHNGGLWLGWQDQLAGRQRFEWEVVHVSLHKLPKLYRVTITGKIKLVKRQTLYIRMYVCTCMLRSHCNSLTPFCSHSFLIKVDSNCY